MKTTQLLLLIFTLKLNTYHAVPIVPAMPPLFQYGSQSGCGYDSCTALNPDASIHVHYVPHR